MAITLLQAQDLVALLHAGTIGTRLWADFLEGVKLRTGAEEALIAVATAGQQSHVLLQRAGRAPTPSDDAVWLSLFAARGVAGSASLRQRRVYSGAEFRDAASGAQIAVLDRFAEESRCPRTRAMWLGEASGATLWILLGRRGEDFTVADGVMLAELGDHLKTALATWAALSRREMAWQAGAGALARQGFAWLQLNSAGEVIDRATGSSEAESEHFRVTATGRFVPRQAADQEGLAAFLSAMESGTETGKMPEPAILPSGQMLLRAGANPDHIGHSAIVYFASEGVDLEARLRVLQAMYGLGPKEARLAILLTQGVSIANAATELGLTLESTRLYSKRLFAKTGTTGQVDLVRTILSGPIALA